MRNPAIFEGNFVDFARRVLQIYHQTTHPAIDTLLGEARQRPLWKSSRWEDHALLLMGASIDLTTSVRVPSCGSYLQANANESDGA
jgi:hypothetical protein